VDEILFDHSNGSLPVSCTSGWRGFLCSTGWFVNEILVRNIASSELTVFSVGFMLKERKFTRISTGEAAQDTLVSTKRAM